MLERPGWIDPCRNETEHRWRAWNRAGLAQLEQELTAVRARIAATPAPQGAEIGDVIDLIALEQLVRREKSLSWLARCQRSLRRSTPFQALAMPVARLLRALLRWLEADRDAT